MSTSLRFSDEMSGWVTFGEDDYHQGYWMGERDGTRCGFAIAIEIDDFDAFIADPRHQARVTGRIDCPGLGGELTVQRGTFNLFVEGAGERRSRMQYRLFATDGDGREVTLAGFKVLEDDGGFDIWTDTTTLRVRLLAGHVEEGDEHDRDARVRASGMLTIGYLGFMKLLASVSVRGGSPWHRARARPRFVRLFAGELGRVYLSRLPREPGDTQSVFPHPTPHEGYGRVGYAPGEWHDLRRGLRRRIVPFAAGDGYPCNLHQIRGERDPTRGPVLLNAGTGVRANIFYDAPLPTSLVDELVRAGYEVWVENWRASIDFPRNEYTLDHAALFDHPAAVRTVLGATETGHDTLKAVVHCQGSTGFFMALVAGLLPQVETVVSNAVSLHPVVSPRSRMKLRCVRPVSSLLVDYIDPQMMVRSEGPRTAVMGTLINVVRRECDNPVCRATSYMYGVGPGVLWHHDHLTPEVHDWVGGEFSWVPMTFFAQIWRSVKAGHLVPAETFPGLPRSFVGEPLTDAKITFMAGTENRCFSAEGQRRSFEHFESFAPGRHRHVELKGYGHLDAFYGMRSDRDVYPVILDALAES